MTHLLDEPESFAETALRGFCRAFRHLVSPIPGGVISNAPPVSGKVAVVIGGGSGHYPAFAGYVGPGMADAAVAGDIFASPSTRLVRDVAARAEQGGGILLGYGNYAGDVLNFGAAAERLRSEGFAVRTLAVTDDIASAGSTQISRRRGVAGDVAVFKIAGAAAAAGLSLDAVAAVATRANDRTRSFGVAFGGCTLPGAAGPLFTVPKGQMAIGLGIHGEPGVAQAPIASAGDLATLLVSRILAEAPAAAQGRVTAILNGLGGTKYEELFVLWSHVSDQLRAAGLTVVAPIVGEFVTSLDMEGCSLTLTWLDDELETFWLAPCETAALSRRGDEGQDPVERAEPDAAPQAVIPPGSAKSRVDAGRIALAFQAIAEKLAACEAELGRIDAQAGDGDHGQGMARGSAAAARAAQDAATAGAGAAATLAVAANAWADRAGGTSGAIWGLGLIAASRALSDSAPATAEAARQAAVQAFEAVTSLGGAKPGDKTLVDAFAPFAQGLNDQVGDGLPLAAAWAYAAGKARDGANGTAALRPRLGRARPLADRSLGHPDAGAVSFAICAEVISDLFNRG